MNESNLKKVLATIKPIEKNEAKERKFVAGVIEKLKKQIKTAKIVLAGSFAKGTFLEGDKDVDIFVLFNHILEKEAMESVIRAAIENAFPKCFFQVAYAQHPYVRVFLEGRKIDVVPVYEVGHGWRFGLKTAADRSVLHTDYIISKMSGKQKDDVRLLKKFLKSNMLYGAEIKVQGFSGYLCELLILKYGTFMNTLKNVAKWKTKTFIDIENSLSQDLALEKFSAPLIVIDPVDKERNVAAVVNIENYFSFILFARSFLAAKNKISFFEKKEFTDAQLKKFVEGKYLYCLDFTAPDIVDDVLWGQIRRFYSTFFLFMKKQGFEIIGSKMDKYCDAQNKGKNPNRIQVLFETLNATLQENKIILGPPLEFEKDSKKFFEQYKKEQIFVLDGKFAAKIKRNKRTVEEMLPQIKKLPLPSHLSSIKNAKMYTNTELIKNCREVLTLAIQKSITLLVGRLG